MRKEIYRAIVERLFSIAADGSIIEPARETADTAAEEPGGRTAGRCMEAVAGERLIKYVDLWNHNVEFLDQEQPWERPAVFVEFTPIVWDVVKPGREYRCKPVVNLHVVTDWGGDASSAAELCDEALKVLDFSEIIHNALQGLKGDSFGRFELQETHTNNNHDELVESIEVYRCVGERTLGE